MGDAWLGDVGIRVTNFERSLAFYHELLDLVELDRKGDETGAYVLLKDRRSGQRLELNYYPESSPFWSPFTVGEGLDHLEVRVRDLPKLLEKLRAQGITPVNRSLFTNPSGTEQARRDPEMANLIDAEYWVTGVGHRVAYIPDPDGNMICLYDHPEENFDDPVPDHY
jgi:catechol 2,3-dioxygenase-like lactoylglutathione lyase family enzyme